MPFVDTSEIEPVHRLPGWSGRTVHSENMTFVHYEIAEGAQAVHEHFHPQEEVWNIIDGELEVTIEGVTQIAGPGCVAIVPAGAHHSVRVLKASRALVVDHPRRDEF
jgi:quercetin dioxygenase-like cupin family protein